MAFKKPVKTKINRLVIRERPERNGVKQPREYSKARAVWDIADHLTAQKRDQGLTGNEQYARPDEVYADATAAGLHGTTIRNDYQAWRRFWGVPRFARNGTVVKVKPKRKRPSKAKPKIKRKVKLAVPKPPKRKAKVPPPPKAARKAKRKVPKPPSKKAKSKPAVPPPPTE